jgi:hypothetical protein
MLQIRMDSANVFNHPVPLEHRLAIIAARYWRAIFKIGDQRWRIGDSRSQEVLPHSHGPIEYPSHPKLHLH